MSNLLPIQQGVIQPSLIATAEQGTPGLLREAPIPASTALQQPGELRQQPHGTHHLPVAFTSSSPAGGALQCGDHLTEQLIALGAADTFQQLLLCPLHIPSSGPFAYPLVLGQMGHHLMTGPQQRQLAEHPALAACCFRSEHHTQ